MKELIQELKSSNRLLQKVIESEYVLNNFKVQFRIQHKVNQEVIQEHENQES